MKIRYFSDIHLEFINWLDLDEFISKIPSGEDEVLIIAGDVCYPHSKYYDIFMNYINENFIKTFVIAGNHEYYSKTHNITQINEYLEDYFKIHDNISFLNNTSEIYNDYHFIGTTLWSEIKNPKYKINDVYQIKDFSYEKYNQMNNESIKFIEESIDKHEKNIIITHHVPSYYLIDKKYKKKEIDIYNQWFYTDMNHIIDKNKDTIKGWFYGHTHTCSIKTIHDIPFLCNPIGYPYENSYVDFSKRIEII